MLKYYNAYNGVRTSNPKESYKNDYEAILEQTFDNAANIFYNEIEYEEVYGSNVFVSIPKVRVDSVITYNSSMLVDGDDYKSFIFMPDFPATPRYGMKFKWGENYWLVISTNNAESLTTTALVRRCNNVLRFYDNNGNKIYEPCIMDTTLRFTRNNDNYVITSGNNEQKVWCQRNNRTTRIVPNDKFLFGSPNQRIAFRLYAGGTKNELNTETMNDNSSTLIEFYVEHYELDAELDDLVNGFANAYANDFSIYINNTATLYATENEATLTATITKNGDIIDKNIVWVSSNEEVATISDGVLRTISEGTATITAYMENNITISDSVDIEVNNIPMEDQIEIITTPDVSYLLQNKDVTIEAYLFVNGIKQDDGCIFTNDTINVPSNKYKLEVIDGNHFKLTNNSMYMNAPVIIKCKIGDIEKNISIQLRGLY